MRTIAKYFIIALVVGVLVTDGAILHAQSQLGQVFITWKTSNFYPAYFEGKALPSLNSPVTVAVEVTKNGALLDLSQAEITWELDGKFIGGGRGVKQIPFAAAKGVGDTHFVRVSVVRGQETFETSLRIPIVGPTVSIDAPYPENRGEEGTITLRALPFFFNVSSLTDLSFSWIVNGVRRETGSDNALVISSEDLTAPQTFRVTLETLNRSGPRETATSRGQFTLVP
ncbi:MAG: hypothetical protein Q8P88_01505 [Candidatus Jorgensenbacteria bacterium]|nr:hypothetical protein [Candidatus Jorgensenbacteria bacterium]